MKNNTTIIALFVAVLVILGLATFANAANQQDEGRTYFNINAASVNEVGSGYDSTGTGTDIFNYDGTGHFRLEFPVGAITDSAYTDDFIWFELGGLATGSGGITTVWVVEPITGTGTALDPIDILIRTGGGLVDSGTGISTVPSEIDITQLLNYIPIPATSDDLTQGSINEYWAGHDTDDLTEGAVNLYEQQSTTDDLTEGSTNLYSQWYEGTHDHDTMLTSAPGMSVWVPEVLYVGPASFIINGLTDSVSVTSGTMNIPDTSIAMSSASPETFTMNFGAQQGINMNSAGSLIITSAPTQANPAFQVSTPGYEPAISVNNAVQRYISFYGNGYMNFDPEYGLHLNYLGETDFVDFGWWNHSGDAGLYCDASADAISVTGTEFSLLAGTPWKMFEPAGSGTNYSSFSQPAMAANLNYTLSTTAPSANDLVYVASTTAGPIYNLGFLTPPWLTAIPDPLTVNAYNAGDATHEGEVEVHDGDGESITFQADDVITSINMDIDVLGALTDGYLLGVNDLTGNNWELTAINPSTLGGGTDTDHFQWALNGFPTGMEVNVTHDSGVSKYPICKSGNIYQVCTMVDTWSTSGGTDTVTINIWYGACLSENRVEQDNLTACDDCFAADIDITECNGDDIYCSILITPVDAPDVIQGVTVWADYTVN